MKVFKTLLFAFKLIIIVGLIIFLNRYPGQLTVVWFGYQLDFNAGIFSLLLIAAVSVIFAMLSGWRWLWQLPVKFAERTKKRRLEKSENLWIESLTAFAAGDLEESQNLSKKSLQLNNKSIMALVLSAQAAYARGDHHKAKELFNKLQQNPKTSFLGLRGLILLSQKDQDSHQFYNLLQQAHSKHPTSPWILKHLLEWDLRHGAFQKAETIVDQLMIMDSLPNAHGSRLKGIIAWKRAQKSYEEEDFETYYESIHQAITYSPELSEAVFSLASYYAESDRHSKALVVLKKGYAVFPLPTYGTICEKIFERDFMKQYQQIEVITSSHPSHPTTFILLAEFAIQAHLWGQARQHLSDYKNLSGITKHYCVVMAQLEQGENPHKPELSKKWLEKSTTFLSTEAWVCRSCHSSYPSWTDTCSGCGEFDSLSWDNFSWKKEPSQLLLTEAC